jgi:phage gpG-like protein
MSTVTGTAEAVARLHDLASPALKRQIMSRIAKAISDNSKKRIKAQTDLDNSAFARRKKGRKKLLIKIGKAIRVLRVIDAQAEIGFSNPVMGKIAAKQQFGDTSRMTVAQARQSPNQLALSAPATRRQASALLDVGFKIRLPNGRRKTPTKKWITEHMTIGSAGAILRALRDEQISYWDIVIPQRSFLGVTETEKIELNATILQEFSR